MQWQPNRRIVVAGLLASLVALGTRALPSVAADEPKSEKGTPSGKVYGGEGGSEFKDEADGALSSITVRSGTLVDSIQCAWKKEGTTTDGDHHGGEGGGEYKVKLEKGEYVTKVTGILGKMDDATVVGSVTIETNKKKYGPYGETTEGEKFTLEAPKDHEVCGFQGRCGLLLDAIGIMTRPVKK